MSKKPNDGGSAFPFGDEETIGLTLRDYFAGQAIVGLLAQTTGSATESGEPAHEGTFHARNFDELHEAAAAAYNVADAMLQAREAGE